MEDYWATRTGRWRKAMRTTVGPSVGERLYQVIRSDVEAKRLPAGALLPASERVAGELVLEAAEVRAAYARLQSEGLVEEREDGRLCISGERWRRPWQRGKAPARASMMLSWIASAISFVGSHRPRFCPMRTTGIWPMT